MVAKWACLAAPMVASVYKALREGSACMHGLADLCVLAGCAVEGMALGGIRLQVED